MALEHLLEKGRSLGEGHYDFRLLKDAVPPIVVDWEPMIRGILCDLKDRLPPAEISLKFHNTLVEMLVAVAREVKNKRVVLSGGCFQNKYLTERAVERLREEGFCPFWHQRVSPNDGSLALGQAVVAAQLATDKLCA